MNTLPLNNFSISYSPSISNQKLNPNKPYKLLAQNIDSIEKLTKESNPIEYPTRMLLNLLKSGLTGKPADEKLFTGRNYEDWARMYNLSHQNAVMPVVLEGLENNSNIKVPDNIKQNMEINKEFAKNYHSQQEWILKKFTEMTSANGIDTVQMKGIGFSMNYPNPTSRFGGDIDIYNYKHGTDPSKPENNMSFIVDKIAKKHGMKYENHGYKHSQLTFHKMPIENHRSFLNVESSSLAKKMNSYLYKVLKPTQEILPHGTKILVPSKEFNTVFISFHAMQHYLGGGINFHHLADWAVHINKHGLKIPEEAKDTKLEKFMYAFTNLANKHLGTNIKVPENKKLEDSIFNRILNPDMSESGLVKPNTKNPFKITKYKIKAIIDRTKTQNEFWGTKNTVIGNMFKSFIIHLKNPKLFINAFTKL